MAEAASGDLRLRSCSIGGALAFAQMRLSGPERSPAGTGDRNEYLTNIAAVRPAGRAAKRGETQRQSCFGRAPLAMNRCPAGLGSSGSLGKL